MAKQPQPTNINAFRVQHEEAQAALRAAAAALIDLRKRMVDLGEDPEDFTPVVDLMPEEPAYSNDEDEEPDAEEPDEDEEQKEGESSGFGRRKK